MKLGRLLASSVAVGVAMLALAGCTLTAAQTEENRQVAVTIGELDPADYAPDGTVARGKGEGVDIACSAVPWLGDALADRSIRCWRLPLDAGATRATAVAIADDLAVASGGVNVGEVCGSVENDAGAEVEVQCASFASMPEARDANVETWVALPDSAVSDLSAGTSAGYYYVTFRLVPYGPGRFESASPMASAAG